MHQRPLAPNIPRRGRAERLCPGAAQPAGGEEGAEETTLHGVTLVDDYYWLRDKGTPEVIAYLEAENAYTDAGMKHTAALQETLYKEMLGRIKESDQQVPAREGGYWYYTRTEQGKKYPIFCRRKGTLDAPEEVYLDQNALADGEEVPRARRPRRQPRRHEAHLPGGPHGVPRIHAVRQGPRDREDPRVDTEGLERHRVGQRQQDDLLHDRGRGQARRHRVAPCPRHAARAGRQGVHRANVLFNVGVGRSLSGKYIVIGAQLHPSE